jgi:cell wall-associated NlpC family hydrolase
MTADKRVRAAGVVLLTAVLAGCTPASAAPSGLDAKRKEATRLQREIERQGERLSIATEDYNEASLTRGELDGKVARARKELQVSEDRWAVLKQRLGRRVRMLYMHPGIWASPLLNANSMADIARQRILAGSVLVTDSDLLLKTEKARADIKVRKTQLEAVRNEARRKENVLADKRAAVAKELRAQQALLQQVQGEIGRILAEDRRRRLAEATKRASTTKHGSVGLPAPKVTGPVRPVAARAISAAAAQIGKPYRWGAAGPDAYDCSGLTMYAWGAAGVSLPHSSRAQFSSLPHVANDQIQPGDLLFYGSPIHHVGIYEGGGVYIHAPESGESVRRDSIYRRDFVGAARPG